MALTACHTTTTYTYTKPTESELRARLTPLQFEVTQHAATEPPFENAYWNNHDAGIYVDVVTGQPLFSSLDKFESGTGWPSFVQPIDRDAVIAEDDLSHGMVRTEVVSSKGRSHLGHVFDDGPAPTNLRYCINSASLRFIPLAKLETEGYGAYTPRFGHTAAALPAATTNACALPKPGEKPGCHATLATAIVIGDADELAKMPGVLQVKREREGVRVTYDPQVYKPR